MNSRIDIPVIFYKSLALFKANFENFLVLGVISALLGGVADFIPDGSNVGSILKGLLTIVLSLAQIAVTISLLLVINSKLLGEELTPIEAFKNSGKYFGEYFLTSLLLGFRLLLVLVPLFILAAVFKNTAVYIVTGIIGGVGFLYIFIHYGFAPLMRVLNPEVNTPFETSFALVKKYRWEVFLITLLTGLLTVPISLLTRYELIPYPLNVILDIASSTFIIPLTLIITVIFYQLLVDFYNDETTEVEEL